MSGRSPFEDIALEDYTYTLAEDRIAQQPLANRDASNLLFYNSGAISHHSFKDVADLLPSGATLFFNDTKVIHARLFFRKSTGAVIEIFLLEPVSPSPEPVLALEAREACRWRVLIGNRKKWKSGEALFAPLPGDKGQLRARVDESGSEVEFRWEADLAFAQILEFLGRTPLPPYIKRRDNELDQERYQTIYADNEGAVAAPTAGLHFTEETMQKIHSRGIGTSYVTLHVGAGTFLPISESVSNHPMHSERMIISRQAINDLRSATFRIAVGTTAVRTLESLYWYGVLLHEDASAEFDIKKDYPYKKLGEGGLPPLIEALDAVERRMAENRTNSIQGETQLFIVPGYRFQVVKALITNFHMPRSTLLLLIAAFVGPKWSQIYETAMENRYRFLSYGDSSFLIA